MISCKRTSTRLYSLPPRPSCRMPHRRTLSTVEHRWLCTWQLDKSRRRKRLACERARAGCTVCSRLSVFRRATLRRLISARHSSPKQLPAKQSPLPQIPWLPARFPTYRLSHLKNPCPSFGRDFRTWRRTSRSHCRFFRHPFARRSRPMRARKMPRGFRAPPACFANLGSGIAGLYDGC
jgi:hypothetical protein